jgi:hypothetical protein
MRAGITGLAIVLLAGQVQAGLIGAWDFSGNALDSSGNGLDGSVSGATLTSDRFGNANSAYLFDGSNDLIRVDNTGGLLSLPGPFTVAAWVRPDSYGSSYTENPILWKLQESYGNWDNYFLTFTGGFTFGMEGQTGQGFWVGGGAESQLGVWYHVAGVYDTSSLEIYVNGEFRNSLSSGVVNPRLGSDRFTYRQSSGDWP